MSKNPTLNNGAIDFESVFKQLNDELSKIEQSLKLICAGGYVMQLHGYKTTSDVDAFYKSNMEIDAVIRKVGDEFGINKPDEIWLNGSISRMNPEPPGKYFKLVYSFTNLEVHAVEINYVVGMKLVSSREQDFIDIGDILRHDNNEQPFTLLSELADMGFNVDISNLLDGFERAHGMTWLDEFYANNQEELRKYF